LALKNSQCLTTWCFKPLIQNLKVGLFILKKSISILDIVKIMIFNFSENKKDVLSPKTYGVNKPSTVGHQFFKKEFFPNALFLNIFACAYPYRK